MATTVLTGRIIRSGSIPATALGGGVISSSTSFATTGSNSFTGNQNINGTVYLTGSLIPSGNFLYDLGSETNSFRDLFISTGSIRFHNPDGTEQGRITVDARSGDISLLKTAGLTNEQKATIRQGNINPDFLTAVSASNLFVQTKIVMPIGGTVNGINLTAFSSSVASTLSNQSAATSSYAINSTIQSQLAGVVSASTQVKPLLPGGTVSASGQVLLNTVSGTTFSNNAFYFPTDVRVEGNLTAQQIYTEYVSSSVIYESGSTKFGDTTDDVMSVTGSISVLGGRISGSVVGMFSSSAQVDYNSITNKLSDVVSSSVQVDYNSITNKLSGVVSSSVQVDYNSITNKLSGVVSSSAQFNALSGTTASFALTSAGGGGGGVAVTYITASNPVGNVNPATSGVLWLNASASELFTCADNFTNLNEWAGTAGTRLYYARTQSSSVTQPVLSGIISGASTNVILTLVDRYGATLTNLITPTQSIQFTSGSSIITLTSSSGIYSGSGKYHSYISTTALSGSATVSASIAGVVVSTNVAIPVLPPRNIRAFGLNTFALFSSSGAALANITSGSGGVQFIDDRTNYWVSASCGYGYCLFLDITGRLYSRGYNHYGMCSQGNTNTVAVITQVTASGGPWKQMSAGYLHACAINSNNELYCWGYNLSGELGLGDTTQRTSAVKVNSDTNWSTISCGTTYTLATKTNGTLWAWGYNGFGNLGDGTQVNRLTPVQIGSDTNWANVFAGYFTSHATKTNGTLWGAGRNDLGQIGNGTGTTSTTFVQVGAATDWVSVTSRRDASSDTFKLGIRGTTLYGWGSNATGMLTSQSIGATFITPTQLTASVPPVKSVDCNGSQVFIIDTGSGLWGWASTDMAANSSSAGSYLAYGTSVNAAFDKTASLGNQPRSGSVQRISSIYTHQQISAINYDVGGLVTITNIQTSSAGPSGAPGIPTASVINNLTACRVQWNNTDITAETRVDIASASVTQSNFIRPGATQVYLRPTTATGSNTIVRLAHIKNEVTSSFVTSSALSFCPAAYSYEISNTCDANGSRTVVYPDGNCGTITQGPYCDYNCGGYTYSNNGFGEGWNPYTGQYFQYETQIYTKGSCSVSFYSPCYAYWFWWEWCYYYNYSGYDCSTGCY